MSHFLGECDLRFPAPPTRLARWEWLCPRRPEAIVLAEIQFIDPKCRVWRAAKGSHTNGLSSPWWLWWIVPPFSGRGIRAAVLHDVACQQKRQPSPLVHAMFYHAARADGAHPIRAWVGWVFIRLFGPKF